MEMKFKVVYLPLDERPCNYNYARQIAEGASDLTLISPPKEIIGLKKTPADFEKIRAFLLENAAEAQACVLSLDTLLYGGIVPSRLHNHSLQELEKRLSVLGEIKRINPRIKIYAFALIMRCPSYSSNDEEPDYYQNCGKEIFLTGGIKHKRELGLISAQEAETRLKELEKVTGEYLSDFEKRREKNLSMLVEILKRKDIDFIVIPQDDSSPYGYTTRDREKLKEIIRQNNLKSVATYPGADEVGMTLLCRAALEAAGKKPKIKCVYAADGAVNLIPLYEDRELYKTLACQIEAAGCVASESEWDITLYLNYPAHSPADWGQAPTAGYAERDMQKFCADIEETVKCGKLAAVADGAFCNGADINFLKDLSSKISLFSLASYAGWNTSSNTLGTAICQAVFVYLYGKNAAQNKFLAERFYEDAGYQAHTRGYFVNRGYDYFNAGEPQGAVAAAVKEETQKFIEELLPEVAAKYEIDVCRMPWSRMFEVELTVKECSKK